MPCRRRNYQPCWTDFREWLFRLLLRPSTDIIRRCDRDSGELIKNDIKKVIRPERSAEGTKSKGEFLTGAAMLRLRYAQHERILFLRPLLIHCGQTPFLF